MMPRSKSLLFLFFSIALFYTGCTRSKTNSDICIYGGTSAGVIAAHTAARMGKSVILIVPDGHIGGLSSGGLGATDIGNKHVITGLSRDFYRKLGKVYGRLESWTFEPKEAHRIFMEYLNGAENITVIMNKSLESVQTSDKRIVAIGLKDTGGDQTAAETVIRAKMFMDCTYEGDLLAKAGVSFTLGREDNSVYGETINGVYLPAYHGPSGYHQFPDHVDPYIVPGDPSSGLLWGISDASLAAEGKGDKKLQAYNFRICLTDSAENRLPITRPEGYDSSRYELLVRLFEKQPDMRQINQYFIWSRMPNRKTDINNRGAFSTDMIGANYEWPEAGYQRRSEIFKEHLAYTQGLLYFYKTDPRVPSELQQFVSEWGYPRDEYTATGHFTPQLYVREGRRMVGEYVMTEHHCRGTEVVEDGVGYAAYTMDSHNCERLVVNGMVKNEGNVEVGGFPPYPVSYRAIVPKKSECTNLLVPVSLSASHIAFGSIRMEPVFMVLGQSAAVAAVLAIDGGKDIQEVDARQINEILQKDPYLNGGYRDLYVDNKDLKEENLSGEWEKRENRHFFSSDLLLSRSKEASVTLELKPEKDGLHKIYYFAPGIADLQGASYAISIESGTGVRQQTVTIDHLNEWIHTGDFTFEAGKPYKLTITANGDAAPLAYDALLLIPDGGKK